MIWTHAAVLFLALASAARLKLKPEDDLDVLKCPEEMMGNGECDAVCFFLGDDGGDCTRDSLCKQWAGDQWCDPLCYDEEHDWDSGDCDYCPKSWYGDGHCDIACNDKDGHDGGDCIACLGEWVGDGYCDEVCMTKEHDFDGGDCYEDFKV